MDPSNVVGQWHRFPEPPALEPWTDHYGVTHMGRMRAVTTTSNAWFLACDPWTPRFPYTGQYLRDATITCLQCVASCLT